MRRCVESGLLLAALVFCTAGLADQAPTLDEKEALRASQAVIGRTVPDHTLLGSDERPVRLSAYRGKPLLVSFIYTGCFQICPTQTRALHDAVKGLDARFGAQQYNVVSIGFNQPFDSPTAMRAFAAQQGIAEPNWAFLSPPAASVEQLTRDFGFRYQATPAGFDHLLGVSIVDAEGRIHSQLYGDRVTARQLGEPLAQLLGAAAAPGPLGLGELIERVRILCTVYDPETGSYRYDLKLILEIAGGLTFFITVGVYLLLDRLRRRKQLRLAHAAQP
jgi:protein SCO1/2